MEAALEECIASVSAGESMRRPLRELSSATPEPQTTTELGGVPKFSDSPQGDSSTVWDIVQELRELATKPSVFHTKALPLALELGRICEQDPQARSLVGDEHRASGTTSQNDDGQGTDRSIVDELLLQVVTSEEEAELVRGAVFLGIAPQVEKDSFRQVFDEWFDSGDTPLELLRAATLAATRRGEEAPCDTAILLEQLKQPKASMPVDLPGIYPLRLTHLVETYEAGVLNTWLTSGDPRSEQFRLSAAPPTSPSEVLAMGRYVVTSELLFTVWGHRSLLERDVEEAVIRAALPTELEIEQRSLIHLRAAAFLVHALGLCSKPMGAAAENMAASANPLLQALAQTFAKVGSGGIAFALIDELEGLRYSEDDFSGSKFMMALREAEEGLLQIGLANPEELELACSYLQGIAQDQSLTELARAVAANAIISGGNWRDVLSNASAILLGNAPLILHVLAIDSLTDGAGQDALRRSEAVDLLRKALSRTTQVSLLARIKSAIAALS